MHDIKIKDYHVVRELGQGGMATVYLAIDKKFDTNVAIKLLNKEYVHNDNIRKRFISEARNMFRMSHSTIIRVTDLIDEGDTVAFVMEYIEGETLKEYLDRKGKLNDNEINNLFTQMLDAVGYVHKQNLVHRDIKPSNFMINNEGQIKLLDFGIAKNTDASSLEYTLTGTGIQMGTPLYMSPEQVKSSKDVGSLSDIYSLGVVLWQMIMGKKPYDSNTLSSPEIQVIILKEPLPITNTNWDDIIQTATEKPIEKRFKNTAEFLNKLINSFNTIQNTNNITPEKTIAENSVFQSDKNFTSNKSNKPKNFFVNNRKLLIGLIVLAAILIYWFNKNQNNEITVPDLANMTEKQVRETLGYLDLDYVLLDSIDFNPAFPKHTVVEQVPSPGAKVKINTKISIKINSSGFSMVRIPNLTYRIYPNVVLLLKELGLEPGQITYKPYIGKDNVLEMHCNGKKLNPGDKIFKSSKIDLVLGDGKADFEPEIKLENPQNLKKIIKKPVKLPNNNLPPANIKRKINANTDYPKNKDDLNSDDFGL